MQFSVYRVFYLVLFSVYGVFYLIFFSFSGFHLLQQGGECSDGFRMGFCYVVCLRRVDGDIVQLGLRVVAQLHTGPVFDGGFVAGFDVFPCALDDGQGVVQVLLDDVVASVVVFPQEGGELVAAVGGLRCRA